MAGHPYHLRRRSLQSSWNGQTLEGEDCISGRRRRAVVGSAAGGRGSYTSAAMESSSLWVFGYGSLIWSPGFNFTASVTGVVRGYSRRFYQGNVTHRGTTGKPGRVATLIEDDRGEVWGRAFRISDAAALPYLEKRECKLGGYLTTIANFNPHNGGKAFPVIVYMATPHNAHWLGHAPECDIAKQILNSAGPSGHNVEYLLRLAEFMRDHLPEIDDPHLYHLEKLVRKGIKENGISLEKLMGVIKPVEPTRPPEVEPSPPQPHAQCFSSMISSSSLRCMSI